MKPTLGVYAIQDRLKSDSPFYVHDHGLVLMAQRRVVKMLTLERLTRKKHDNTLHEQLFDLLKNEGLLFPDDYDLVFVDNVVGRAMISDCGRLRFEAPLVNKLSNIPELGRAWWGDREREAYVLNHELSHLGSCLPFYETYKANSLLIHFDGGASHSNFSAWHYTEDGLKCIEYHWDLKYLSSFFNANALMFGILDAKFNEQNSVPGKLMGFASYGNYSETIEKWLHQNDFFKDVWGRKTTFYQSANKYFGWNKNQLLTTDPFLQDIAATIQYVFEREFLVVVERLKNISKSDHLYLAGGSALNIVLNAALVNKGWFKSVNIPPCTEDSGLALGAAAFVEHLKHGVIEKHSPYINNWGIDDVEVKYNEADIEQCANAIFNGAVIGLCNGVAEAGPRALGNRSIIARADRKQLAEKVSRTHKNREWYRPVAPVMLESNAKYFTGLDQLHPLSKYMLLDFEVLENRKSELEGAVHIDGTARIQSITNREDNPFLFDLLSHLDRKYGIRALINTSFNYRGEPIVHTTQDAINSARIMKLDGVVLNGKYYSEISLL